MVVDDESVATTFVEYFHRITEDLDIPTWKGQNLPYESDLNKSLNVRFKDHPSIKTIQDNIHTRAKFDFSHVDEHEVLEVIKGLNKSKSVSGKIPTRILKLAANLCVPFLTNCFNQCIDTNTFPDELKVSKVLLYIFHLLVNLQ